LQECVQLAIWIIGIRIEWKAKKLAGLVFCLG